jgi:hypothetical protein
MCFPSRSAAASPGAERLRVCVCVEGANGSKKRPSSLPARPKQGIVVLASDKQYARQRHKFVQETYLIPSSRLVVRRHSLCCHPTVGNHHESIGNPANRFNKRCRNIWRRVGLLNSIVVNPVSSGNDAGRVVVPGGGLSR